MKKSFLSIMLVLVLILSLTTMAFGAPVSETKIIQYEATDDPFLYLPASIKVTNVKSQERKDFSTYLSDDDKTISGKDSIILHGTSPMTITLLPYEGENNEHTFPGAYMFYLAWDGNKVDSNTITRKDKYYTFDDYELITDKKYDILPERYWIYADGSSMNITEVGTYVLYTLPYGNYDTEDVNISPVFIIIDEATTTIPDVSAIQKATPTASTVLVDNLPTEFEAYNINNNNYFKLRDLAQVVNRTEKNFEVEWDGSKNAINLKSKSTYTPVGGELVKGDMALKQATPTTSKIYKDGKEVKLTAYNINGNNFFKLRDIAQVFDIGVTWDGTTNTVGIDTSIGYTEDK